MMQAFARAAGRRGVAAPGWRGQMQMVGGSQRWASVSSVSSVSGAAMVGRVSRVGSGGKGGSRKEGRILRITPKATRSCSTVGTSSFALNLNNTAGSSFVMTDREVLPKAFKPAHYDLSLYDLEFKNWTYNGSVTIDVAITEATKELVLNVLEVKLTSAKVIVGDKTFSSTDYQYNDRAQRVTVAFSEDIPASAKAKVVLKFNGIMNNEMAGFYRSKYKPVAETAPSVPRDDEWHYMLSTQFESCDARRAFPCFDEPNLKATFDFAIEIPDDQVALSNMPVKEEVAIKVGWKKVSFETSPIMSSYLLAWAVGDFEYVEAFTERKYQGKQIPVRVYTTRGLKEQGQWALEHAPKIIDFFSDIFGIEYPLPKADLIAVHEFTHGAMENWGLVTYRTTQVLYDPKNSSARSLNLIAYVVAHELAHQWFGNLVTMDWWDELWLNEGFATWVGWHAVDHLHPEWEVWAQFVNEGMESAFRLDSIRSSHPIHVPVADALDVNQIFDHISYLKGCSAIRMLANHLGVETFLKGVANYLQKHAYGNAKTQALWDSLSEASGQDVSALMAPWISKIGHPVVQVEETGNGDIKLKQNRFLITGDIKPEEDETTWWVPLAIEGVSGTKGVAPLALTAKEDTISGVDSDFFKVNSGATGFYRIAYTPERLAKLGTQLDRLSVEEKINILGSLSDLSSAGQATVATFLEFAKNFKNETNTLVWSQVLDSVLRIRLVFREVPEIKEALNKYVLELISDAVEKIGYDFVEGEPYLTTELRKRLIGAAAACDHPKIVEEQLKRFDQWAADNECGAIHPNLRASTWRTAIRKRPETAYQIVKDHWFNTKSFDGKAIALSVLGAVTDAKIIKNDTIPFLFALSPPAAAKDSAPSADMHSLGGSLAANVLGRDAQWEFMQKNWKQCITKLGNPVVVDRFIKVSLSSFTELKYIDEIGKFFADKDTSSFNRTLETAKDRVRAVAAFKTREEGNVKAWLKINGYLA